MLTVTDLPTEIVETILQRHLDDRSAHLTTLDIEPIASDGFSGNHLFRARLAWTSTQTTEDRCSATWVLKRWLPGGQGEHLLGVEHPLEALAWQDGLLRPAALPAGLSTPIVGTRLDPDGRSAWIAMEDVGPALRWYSREAPLHPTEASTRARLILDRMARLHTRWERPAYQETLRRMRWLVPMERFLCMEADRCAIALGRAPRAVSMAADAVSEEFRDDLTALLAWMPAGDRAMFAELFSNRERLLAALRPLPRTLIHGDLGDRNVGLRPSTDPAAADEADLVLIDWEWVGFGTPALDVARLWASFPIVCDPSLPLPEIAFSVELPAYYFERYRAYGGILQDEGAWLRACALAQLGLGMSQVSFMGSMIRHDVRRVMGGFARQLDTIARAARTLFDD